MLAKNLRIVVVPTEEGYDIDQNSDCQDILSCEGAAIYGISEYLQAQNDEELPLHWSFLFDIATKTQVHI